MAKITNFIKKFLDPDTQAIMEAGFIRTDDSGSLNLTKEGRYAVLEILFLANKAALVEKAKEVIAEREAEAKK